jgi:hypothetical protein
VENHLDLKKETKNNKMRTSPIKKKTENSSTTGILPGLMSGVFQGFSFGTGSAFANNLFRLPKNSFDACQELQEQFVKTCKNVEFNNNNQCKKIL